jgi:hypothetical protein
MVPVALTSLHPTWIDGTSPETAKGLEFDCPACLQALRNHAPPYIIGHRVEVWFIPKSCGDTWEWSGRTFEDLTISPSIDGTGPGSSCRFHGYIRAGHVTW